MKSGVKIDYLFVKRGDTVKKLLYPQSFIALKKTVAALFKINSANVFLYDEDGKCVESLSLMPPNSTVTVSDHRDVQKCSLSTQKSLKVFGLKTAEKTVKKERILVEESSDEETQFSMVSSLSMKTKKKRYAVQETRKIGRMEAIFREMGIPPEPMEKAGSKNDFYGKAKVIEDEHIVDWCNTMTRMMQKQEFIDFSAPVSYAEEISRRLLTVVEDGNVAIVGPRLSGKSTMLSILADQVINEFAVTNNWKKTLFVPINGKLVVCDNYRQFTDSMVSMFVDCLVEQRPILKQYATSIKKSILTGKIIKQLASILEFRDFADEIARIGEILNRFIETHTEIGGWLTVIWMLPALLALSAGFTNVFFIIDNIDYLDKQIQPREPFEGAETTEFMIEFVKFALANSSFIISCEDESKFREILMPIDSNGVDLSNSITSVATFDIDLEIDQRLQKPIIVELPDAQPMTIPISACGRCPVFLSRWEEIHNLLKQTCQYKENTDEYEDTLFSAIEKTEQLLSVLFDIEDCRVSNVRLMK